MKNEILVVIDMQNDFINGSLGTKEAEEIVKNMVSLIQREPYKKIFVTKDTHEENYLETLEGKKLPVKHCISGTGGWAINKDVMSAIRIKSSTTEVHIITKYTFGSDYLVEELRKIVEPDDEIILAGLCTDICVVSNALLIRAAFPDNIIKVESACCAGVTPETHDAALATMGMCQIDII